MLSVFLVFVSLHNFMLLLYFQNCTEKEPERVSQLWEGRRQNNKLKLSKAPRRLELQETLLKLIAQDLSQGGKYASYSHTILLHLTICLWSISCHETCRQLALQTAQRSSQEFFLDTTEPEPTQEMATLVPSHKTTAGPRRQRKVLAKKIPISPK